jgi:hypothetical protein
MDEGHEGEPPVTLQLPEAGHGRLHAERLLSEQLGETSLIGRSVHLDARRFVRATAGFVDQLVKGLFERRGVSNVVLKGRDARVVEPPGDETPPSTRR